MCVSQNFAILTFEFNLSSCAFNHLQLEKTVCLYCGCGEIAVVCCPNDWWWNRSLLPIWDSSTELWKSSRTSTTIITNPSHIQYQLGLIIFTHWIDIIENDSFNPNLVVSSSSWGYPSSWMLYFRENPNLKWMICGYHSFRRLPVSHPFQWDFPV